LESNTGKVLWEKVLSQGKKLDDVDASPVVDSGRVYASSYQVGLYCIDAETGAVLWTVDQGSDRPVVIHKNSLFYSTSDGYIMALDKHSGKQIWSHPVRGNGTTPFYDKDHLLFGESDGALVILNAVTGTKVAEFFSGRGLSARPIKGSNDIVYIISNDNNLYALRESWRPQFAKGTGALD
jgi:outer membrane protein assembly factor BamB